MPHLQASLQCKLSPGGEQGPGTSFGSGRAASGDPSASASSSEHLPIQEATKGYLGTSDPVVAMANKAEKAEKVSFDESVEGGSMTATSSPSAESRISKSLVTPSPHASQSRLPAGTITSNEHCVETAPASGESSASEEGSPPILTIYGSGRLFHSPIRVKRRVSHSEDDEVAEATTTKMNSNTASHLRYGGASPVKDMARPVLIRRGSSMGKRSSSDDSEDVAEGTPASKRAKADEGNNDIVSTEDLETSVEEAAAAMAGMRKKPVISPSSSGEKLESHHEPMNARPPMPSYNHRPPSQYYQHSHHQAPYHYPPYSHPSYGYGSGSHSMYHGYLPHAASGHPPHSGYYPPYPNVPPHSAMHAYRPPPYAPALDHPTKKTAKATPNRSSSSSSSTTKDAAGPESAKPGSETYSSVSSEWQPAAGMPPSTNRCVPLKEPVPNKAWGDNDESKEAALPDFHRLVNYPDFLTKTRNEANCPNGRKNCVMCGKFRICSATTTYVNKGRHGNAAMLKAHMGGESEDTAHIIPRQNKGLCTACDVTVWILVSENLEIKWCKGCKNFRPWAAFGDKGSATKCVRCRDRQREKYALQRDEMRSRRNPRGSSASPSDSVSSSTADQAPIAAAQGLHSLLNAATSM